MTYHRWITAQSAIATIATFGLFWFTDFNPWLGFVAGVGFGTTLVMAMLCWRWKI